MCHSNAIFEIVQDAFRCSFSFSFFYENEYEIFKHFIKYFGIENANQKKIIKI